MTVVFPVERQAQRTVLAVAFTFTSVAIVACSLRALARRLAHRSLDSSDWCIFAACLVTVVYQSINITSVFICGVGFHFTEIIAQYGVEPITLFLKFLLAIQLLWALSLSLSKISILVLYSKIFSIPAFVWAAKITTAVIVMWALATVLMGFLICRPFAFNWDQTIPGGHCGNQVLSYQVTGALNLATDVVVLLLPMPYLYSLNLALYKKLVLMVTFAVGLFVLRLIALSSIDYSDITFNVPESLIFSGLEPCLAVTLACVPVLRPLLGRVKDSFSGSGGGGTGLSSSGKGLGSGKFGSKGNPAFEPLADDSSQYRLRPIGPKHTVEAKAAQRSSWSGHSSDPEGRQEGTGDIVVRQEWVVAAERK